MSKRLILVLAFAFLVGCAVAAYAEVQNVKVSGDLNVLGVTRHFGEDRTGIISITRVKVDADLTDNVMTTVRLINERYWGTEIDNPNVAGKNTDIDLDLAMVTLKEFLYSPLTLTIGRQELHFGSEMIVGDVDTNIWATNASALGTPLRDPDLSARKAFDAIRATLNYDPLVIDAIYALVDTNNNISDDANDDTLLFGINANYKVNAKNTVEGYWFERKTQRKATAGATPATPKKTDQTDVIGGRITSSVVDNMILSLEAAYQFGKIAHLNANEPSVDRKAWALETAATYNFSNKKYKPSATALYSYFSGDHENGGYATTRGAFKGWDPMFENQKSGDIANALLNQTNAHIIGGILTAQAAQDILLKGEYYAIWWAKAFPDRMLGLTMRGDNLTTTERRFVGQEVDLTATYNYTEDVQFSLMGGWLIMGPAIMEETNKVNSEVIGSMKVTF
jgi:hypothetical protein